MQGFRSAPERTRTSTDHKVHKALNLARLPIPPQALEAASIALRGGREGIFAVGAGGRGGRLQGFCSLDPAACGGRRVESVLGKRYSAEHMFDSLPINEQIEQGAERWT
jgi:hypothetical protein